jgi:hypothetical protein
MSHWIRVAFNTPNLPSKSIGRRAYVVLLIATTIPTVLCGGSAAFSGSCSSSDKSGTRHSAGRAAPPLHNLLGGCFITSRRPKQC